MYLILRRNGRQGECRSRNRGCFSAPINGDSRLEEQTRFESLRDILKDASDAETQLTMVLPKMEKSATSRTCAPQSNLP
jgi:hypothetical protein